MSPDQRFAVYTSQETGRNEVYVRTFPDPAGGRWSISENGGSDPAWAPDGRSIYYWEDTRFRVARLRLAPTFGIIARETLFTDAAYVSACCLPNYDIHPDGKRIVLSHRSGEVVRAENFTIVTNWIQELRTKTAAAKSRTP